jgi:hypothetical protein
MTNQQQPSEAGQVEQSQSQSQSTDLQSADLPMLADQRFQIVPGNQFAIRDYATGTNYQLRSLKDATAMLELLHSLLALETPKAHYYE